MQLPGEEQSNQPLWLLPVPPVSHGCIQTPHRADSPATTSNEAPRHLFIGFSHTFCCERSHLSYRSHIAVFHTPPSVSRSFLSLSPLHHQPCLRTLPRWFFSWCSFAESNTADLLKSPPCNYYHVPSFWPHTRLPSSLCPHPFLGPTASSSSLAPVGLLSGNQAGRAHFSAHIIFPIITNEYELPSVGHTRRESGREGGGGGRGGCVSQCACVVLSYKQAHALLVYMGRRGLTHAHIFSQTRSLLTVVLQLIVWMRLLWVSLQPKLKK